MNKGVEYLVEASAAEAEAISATLAAAKARQVNGEVELPDRDRGAEATPSGKPISSLIKPDSAASNNVAPGVRLHHRAVSITFWLPGEHTHTHTNTHTHTHIYIYIYIYI